MSRDFKELVGKYERAKESISEQGKIVYDMCKFLKEVTYDCVDGIDLSVYNPFDFSYNEGFNSFWVEGTTLNVHLQYTDVYEGYDSDSTLKIPKHFVDLFLNGEFAQLKREVLRLCERNKCGIDTNNIENLKRQAEELGYVLVKEGVNL